MATNTGSRRGCAARLLARAAAYFALVSALANAQQVPPPSREFQASFDGSPLLLPVTLRGREYLFVVDTGCTDIVFDTSLRPLLGERLWVRKWPQKPYVRELFPTPEASVGGVPLEPTAGVICADLGPLRRTVGSDVYGLLGLSFLRKYAIRVDPETKKLRFLKSEDPRVGTAVPMKDIGGLVGVDADIPGFGSADFVIDTGLTGHGTGAVSPSIYTELTEKGSLLEVGKGIADGLGGRSTFSLGALDAIVVGGFQHSDVLLASDRETQNLLGLNFVSRYVTTLDFPAKTIYLKPTSCIRKFVDMDLSGLYLARENDGCTTVEEVADDSPADIAGVVPGDTILEIAHRQTEKMRFDAILRAFCEESSQVEITIERGGQRFALTLKMR